MFAFAPIVTALLALSSSVLSAHANGMEEFTFNLAVTFDDPDSGKITDADKKILEDGVVTSFNNVHDTSVIKLESFELSTFGPGSFLSKILPGYLGNYNYGGGSGRNCRMCGSDDLLTDSAALRESHSNWQHELKRYLENSGSPGLASATHVRIVVDSDESGALSEVDTDTEVDTVMEEFEYSLSITFDDPGADKITDADKKILEDGVVTSFNNVHDTSVIKLESFTLSTFEPGTSGYLGNYNYGGGSGRNCRMCGSDDLLTDSTALRESHSNWQHELKRYLENSGSPGLAEATHVRIVVDGDETGALSEVDADDMEEFDYSLSITFTDPKADMITDSDKKIVEDAVVTSFNNVHDTSVINLESFKFNTFEPGASGYLGNYNYGGGSGRNCRMCGNDDMMLGADMIKSTHAKWQTEFNKILLGSGSPGLAEVTNVVIKVDEDDSGFLAVDVDDGMEEFTFNMAISFNDPEAVQATDTDKEIFSDCVVSSFNTVHDTSVIELTNFDMTEFTADTGMLSLLRGSTTNLGNYGYGGGSGRNCRMCGNDDLLEAGNMLMAAHLKWQEACEKCLAESGSSALASTTNVQIKIDSDSTEAAE